MDLECRGGHDYDAGFHLAVHYISDPAYVLLVRGFAAAQLSRHEYGL
jgi:hypothetical protein